MNDFFARSSTSQLPVFSRGPVIFVWSIWVVMLLMALACIFLYGRNIPLAEDWLMVAPLTGNEPDMAGWLWMQNNEHRIPLPKIIFLFLLKITNGDFRSGMVLNVMSAGLLAAGLIRVFKYIRGKTIYPDAFFPIILLHIGNWENFFWSWQIGFVLPTVLACTLIIIIVRYTGLLQLRIAIIAAICTICLPLCGANGLMYLLPTIPLLSYEAVLHFRSKEAGASRRVGVILFSAIGLTIFILVVYFIGYERPYWNPPSPDIKSTLVTSAKFMALGLGPGAASSWRLSVFTVMILLASTAILLLNALLKSRGVEFRRCIGIIFFMSGCLVFALAMGWGRAALIPKYGLPIRYVLLAIPALIICYSSWEIYGSPFLRNAIQWSLFLVMFLMILPNTKVGFSWRNWYLNGADAVFKDIKNGIPNSRIAERNQTFLLHWDKQMLINRMQQLKEAGMGPFKNMKDDQFRIRI